VAPGLWGISGLRVSIANRPHPDRIWVGFALATFSLRRENKVVAHIVVLLTIILTVALIVPLRGALNRDDLFAALRIGIMLAGCVVAMVAYFRSFIEARRGKS